MPGSISFEFTFAKPAARPDSDDVPCHILLMGNLSGHAAKPPLAQRTPLKVDIDCFDAVLARCAPRLDLDLAGTRVTLGFRELDDFLPDAIYRRVPLFAALREQLGKDLAARLPLASAPEPAPAAEPASLFQSLLGGTVTAKPAESAFEAMVRDIVKPHLTLAPETSQSQMVLQDAACSLLLRAILHHPDFQALEAAWRNVHYLISQLDLDGDTRLFLLDLTKEELAADCAAHGDNLGNAPVWQVLGQRAAGGPDSVPWALLVGQYAFDASDADVATLAATGAMARQLNAPFLAAADPAVAGCPDIHTGAEAWQVSADQAARWQALRTSRQAPWLGLVLPRLILRVPYGAKTDPVESFAFEEMGSEPLHQQFLWGNAAVACAGLIGQAFADDGWDLELRGNQEIDSLPAYAWRRQGEPVLQPCAEVVWPERTAQLCVTHGLMPLQSYSNKNAVRLMIFQSLAGQPLAGRWNQVA